MIQRSRNVTEGPSSRKQGLSALPGVTHHRKDEQIGMPIDPVEVVVDEPGTYLQWGVIQISVANLIVIGLMLLVFVLALFLPFPGGRRRP